MSRDMTKPTKWECAHRRLRSAWASAQSNQSLRCPHEETLGPWLPIERTAKTLIRLGGFPGWSESSLANTHFVGLLCRGSYLCYMNNNLLSVDWYVNGTSGSFITLANFEFGLSGCLLYSYVHEFSFQTSTLHVFRCFCLDEAHSYSCS